MKLRVNKYSVEPFDAPNRWLVLKSKSHEALLVELGKDGKHVCSCIWGQFNKSKTNHCKHIRLAIKHVLEITK